jgi:hypothetical protein
LFDGTQVDGINFEKLEFRDIVGTISQQPTFHDWLHQCLQRGADRMMKEYIRLTNIAFGVNCSSPPVFLLDEVQVLSTPTTMLSKIRVDISYYHTFLSMLLFQLAGQHKPVCICTGTNIEELFKVIDAARIIARYVALTGDPSLQYDFERLTV